MSEGHPPLFPDPVDPTEERVFAPRKAKRSPVDGGDAAGRPPVDPTESDRGGRDEGDDSDDANPSTPSSSTRSMWQRVLVGSGLIVVIGLVAVAGVVGYGWWRWSQIGRENLALASATDGPQNYLIVGSDTRTVVGSDDADADAFIDSPDDVYAGERSDTIMLVRVDPDAGTVDMISFPRDLWVEIPGTEGHERINTAYGLEGGPQRLVDTIKMNFGIDVNHYVEVDFRSFKGVVDAVGGVPMYFDQALRDTNSGLYIDNPGCVTLDGDQALAFSRARHLKFFDESKGRWVDDPTADLGRISRQQEFIRKMIDRSASATKGFDVKAVNDIIGSTADNVTIDSGLDLGDFLGLATAFKSFSGDQIVTHTLPVEQYTTAGGAAVLKLDDGAAQPALNVFRGLPPGEVQPDPAGISLSIQNGSGTAGQAGTASTDLADIGFEITDTGDASEAIATTVVRYAPGSARAANLVLSHLSAGGTLELDDSLDEGEIVLVTGADFSGVSDEALDVPPVVDDSSSTSTTSMTADPDVIADAVGVVPEAAPDGTTCT